MHQHALSELFPGSPGGRALAATCTPGHYSRIGAAGGASTVTRYGRSHMSTIGAAGRAAQRRGQLAPRRIVYDDQVVTIFPWFPPQSHPAYNSRRRRPIQVWVWEGTGDE